MNWTPEASARFESYKGRVRLAVAGNPGVDPDDVLQDIQAHVQAELGASGEPITIGALDRVLDGLGSPSQWDAVDAPPSASGASFRDWVRRSTTLWHQRLSGDWGGPVLVAVLTVVALDSFQTIGLPLLALCYVIGRGMLARRTDLTGPPRWLAAAPVVAAAALLIGAVVAFPILIDGNGPRVPLMALGFWWILLGYAVAREPRPVRAALYPLAEWFEPTHGRLLTALGIAMVVLGIVRWW
jgi:hypothetical protein